MSRLRDKKYVPNLQQLQAICTRNYGLLLRLLPLSYELGQSWEIEISDQLSFSLTVTEISRYTEVFSLIQKNGRLPAVFNTEINFRAYHDAQMLEVTSFQNHKNIRANNPYPNPKLHQKDEKFQVNQLLREWLNMASNFQGRRVPNQVSSSSI